MFYVKKLKNFNDQRDLKKNEVEHVKINVMNLKKWYGWFHGLF